MTLIDLFKERSQLLDVGITFIRGVNKEEFLSYAGLYESALSILAFMQKRGIEPKSEIIIQLENNKDFLIVFWACILGGIIPIPVTVGLNNEHYTKLFNIWKILTNPFIFGTKTNLEKVKKFAFNNGLEKSFIGMENGFLQFNEITSSDKYPCLYEANEDDLAFVQFSSGSTGEPKGVMLTHKNLITNLHDISKSANYSIQDKMLSWMPLTHDMGLIGFHLNPLYIGMDQYLMPSNLFIRRPSLWLDKVSEHKASVICSPNFGYHYLLKHRNDSSEKNLNLSSVRVLYNGAEPISTKLCKEFTTTFKQFGLKEKSLRPVYGLAEASLAVCMSKLGKPIKSIHLDRNQLSVGDEIQALPLNESGVSFVNVGSCIENCNVRITNNYDIECPKEVIGNIQIKGDNVTSGYYNDMNKTKDVFSKDGWLKTGDLGFVQKNSLYITGRAKDIIFKNGQNLYSHDIERVAENVNGVELNKIAVASFYNGSIQEDEVIGFVMYRQSISTFIRVVDSLNATISEHFGFQFSYVIPLKKIPKTTSGKLQRFKLLDQYRKGVFNSIKAELDFELKSSTTSSVSNFQSISELEYKLQLIWKKVLGINKIGLTDNFFAIGGNSLRLAEVSMHIHKEFHVEISLNVLYENQTITLIAKKLSNCKKQKYEPIPITKELENYPLSYAQEMLYYAWEANKLSVAYNNPSSFLIEKSIDVKILQDCLECLIKDNRIFKMTFEFLSEPNFYFHDFIDCKIDSYLCLESELNDKLKSFIQPFDLKSLPLFRIKIINVEDRYSILFLDFHHIIIDGISVYKFLEDLSKLYDGKALGKELIDYKDFVVWERNTFVSGQFSEQEKYWSAYLSGNIPILNLPTDFIRPSILSTEGGKIEFTIDIGIVNRLNSIANTHFCTPFVLIFTVYQVFLSKFSGQKELMIGVPVSGRKHPSLRNMYGMFVNSIALKCIVNDNDTFVELLKKQNDNVRDGLNNQEYPFQEVIANIDKKRDVSRNPIFDTMFIFQNMVLPNLNMGSLKYSKNFFDTGYSKFDLSLEIFQLEDSYECAFEYNSKLFKKETIVQLTENFQNLIIQISEFPSKRISELNMIGKTEFNKKIFAINTTKKHVENYTIHELFEQQVVKTPGNIALEFNNKKITYDELNDQANLLADYLDNLCGVQKTVALILDRNPNFFVSILAILKSGRSFLPIDFNLPKERIKYVINDSRCNTVITCFEHSSKVEHIDGLTLIDVDKAVPKVLSKTRRSKKMHFKDLAYVIYTSGTSGEPKGVMVEHKSLVNYTIWAADYYLEKEKTSFPFFTSAAFDLCITSIFTPLITGNKVIIYDDRENEILIQNIVLDNKVNIIKLTPSHLKLLRENRSTVNQINVKKIIVGGEKLDFQLASQIHEIYDGRVEIYNEYGPTEATVGCMIHKFEPSSEPNSQSVPIGKPIYNTQIYILDKFLNPTPVGVVGEIYISGNCLSRGYMFNEELTCSLFVPNPFAKGKKMYKSGDLAKYLIDGNIEYIGRHDNQVKINGYRVELSAIEKCIRAHKMIEDAIVTLKKIEGKEILVTYVKSKTKFENNRFKELKNYLRLKLPRYMIPSHFVSIKNIPLTNNGKLNYERLPKPIIELEVSEKRRPKNKIEELLVKAWEEILAVNNLSVDDNFFELGGDSIQAVRIASKLRENGIGIEGKDILTFQTVELISNQVKKSKPPNSIDHGLIEGEVGFTPILSWFFNKRHKNINNYCQSVLLFLKGNLDITILKGVIKKLTEHHDVLRLNFNKDKSTLFYNNSLLDSEPVIKEIFVNNREELNAEREVLKKSIDIESSLLIKCAILNLANSEKYLFISAHHIAIDGVSWRIILTDFYNSYKQISEFNSISLPSKSSSFMAWSQKLIDLFHLDKFRNEVEYWNRIELTKFCLTKNTSKQKPKVKDLSQIQMTFDKVFTHDLLLYARKVYRTDISTLLISSLTLTLKEWNQYDEYVMYMENHGRSIEEINVSNTLGWFTSLYPVRLEYELGISNLIKRTKEILNEVPNNGVGYGINKYYSADSAIAKGIPEITFNYLGQFGNEVENDVFSLNPTDFSLDSDPLNFISAMWEWNLMIIDDQLHMRIDYYNKAFNESDMHTIIHLFKKNLSKIMEHLRREDDIHLTSSDFDTIDLDDEELKALFD
ncbi:amino acid adenylation domain-containing protein [Maribacter sp. 2307UL18-2]|uniref:amino acid adenylation domain-containing protein n=1 Tax=Maribacter sp. 2307UL18-2 TaxID=3386274 RepID=UPI0039BCBAAC